MKKKIGRVFIFNCNVKNSDEVLDITTTLSKDDSVLGCDAFTDVTAEFTTNNPLYTKQYNLHNTTSNSIGINAEAAWEIASGLGVNVTIAVIDEGVDHNHEDLSNVLDGFTGCNPFGKGDPDNTNSTTKYTHGVACAGIIGAANNDIGIRGIASNGKILPANIAAVDPNPNRTIDLEYAAEAIVWASERADVLSC